MKAYHDQGKQEMMMMMIVMTMIMKYEGCRVNTHMKYNKFPTIASHFNCIVTQQT